ncbi:MAG: DUF5615 family PIN-like protein [Phycisphaerae bacterium]|nr:DUF5615 family PIN-like protein [Phycisphaerae bacterium]
MRLIIDMNLSAQWANYLEIDGHFCIHWASCGARNAKDREIFRWAADHQHIVITNDLDFGTLLAFSSMATPSVVLIRGNAVLPRQIGPLVRQSIRNASNELLSGAILIIAPGRVRLRTLALVSASPHT